MTAGGGVETVKESLTVQIGPRLAAYIATRDKRCLKAGGWKANALSEHFAELLRTGYVKVGGRASCGPRADPTWVEFTAWNEIVKKASTFGYAIEVTPIKHGNGSPTRSGGFWDENEYRFARRASAIAALEESP